MYPKNAASPQRIAIGAVVQISDGVVQTSGVSVKVMPQGGAASAGGGTIAYEEGIVHYVPTQAETNYASFIVIAYKTGCIPVAQTIVTSASGVAGYAGLDWATINAPTTTQGLSGTTIKTATDVETDTADIQTRLPAALVGGRMDANVSAWNSTALSTTNPLPNAAAGASNGLLISGSNSGTTTFGALTVTGALTVSDGVIITASTTNRSAISATGNGTGYGASITGGSTAGDGIRFVGGAGGGNGARFSGTGGGIGAVFAGNGSGTGVTIQAGATGVGAVIVGGTTSGDGMQIGAFGSGNGLLISGAATGHGATITSGAGATGDGVQMTAASTNGNALKLTKTGTGLALSGATTDLTLAKTTNITGFNDIAATAIVSSGAINTSGGAVSTVTNVTNAVAITSNVKKNQALAAFMFMMTDSTGHAPATGKTVTVTRSIDGGAFGAGGLSAVTEVSNGMYKVDFAQADMNGNVIVLRATATACDDTFVTIITQP